MFENNSVKNNLAINYNYHEKNRLKSNKKDRKHDEKQNNFDYAFIELFKI